MIAKQYFSISIDKFIQHNIKWSNVSFLKVNINIYFLFETKCVNNDKLRTHHFRFKNNTNIGSQPWIVISKLQKVNIN